MTRTPPGAVVAIVGVLLLSTLAATAATTAPTAPPTATPGQTTPTDPPTDTADDDTGGVELVTADSPAAFRAYLDASRWVADHSRGGAVGIGQPEVVMVTDTARAVGDPPARTDAAARERESGGGDGGETPRHSRTNVQVEGIDEPDLVKTDGNHVYYTGTDDRIARVIDALPAADAGVVARLPESGQLLLAGDTLVVLGDDRVAGYDVADPTDPELVWDRSLESQVRTARLHDGTLYLVLATSVDRCPVEPLAGATVDCTDVHHPREPRPVSVTYTLQAVDPTSGTVGESFSMAGGADATVYMSPDALVLADSESRSVADVQLEYLLGPGRERLPGDVAERLETVRSYDLGPRARQVAVAETLERWLTSLDEERRHRVQSRLAQGVAAYVADNRRELTTTSVVRVPVEGSALGEPTVGSVPGQPLDQFSVDEHEGHLRIATTVGERWRWLARDTGEGAFTTENDVYVLDTGTLEVTGSVTGMGETERIYAVRFQGDRGYVVTYRQIDPFHVLDLSDPDAPTLEGELKLPGFSTYLHPLGGERVLGVGEEDGRVKLVTFDVSDPTDPTVARSRTLDARWSGVSRSHHAFLHDPRHGVFFLPTATGGQVFDAETLDRVARVRLDSPRRAVYVGDHLYVLGSETLVVLDERSWEPVRRTPLD